MKEKEASAHMQNKQIPKSLPVNCHQAFKGKKG